MAEMALIKYHYAYDESKQVININDVSSIERSKHSYYCVGCGAEMIPRLGKIKGAWLPFQRANVLPFCKIAAYDHASTP